MMDIFDACMLRTPVRKFSDERIPDEKLECILDAARWAPSPENVQHHRFIIVRDEETKKLIAESSEEIYSARKTLAPAESFIQKTWWLPEETRAAAVEDISESRRSEYIENADVVLLPLANGNWYDAPVMVAPEHFGAIVTAMAVQNVWTAAVSLGVGGSLLLTPFLDPRRRMLLQDLLGVPHDWCIIGALALGIPEHGTLRAHKFPLESIAFDGYWGRKWKRVGFREEGEYRVKKMDALDAIYLRRSIREFLPEDVEDWKIEKLLDAARFSPSPGNTQPWRWIVVRDEETKKLLADAAWEAARFVFGMVPWEMVSDRLWYLPPLSHPKIMEYMADGSLMRYPEHAAVNILGLLNSNWMDAPIAMNPPLVGFMTISMAIQAIWNCCPALGLGLGFNALTMADPRKKRLIFDQLGIPHDWDCFAALSIGIPKYPRIASPPRFPLEGLIFDEYWGRRYKRIGLR